MACVKGEFVSFGEERDEQLAAGVQDNWPHAYARLQCAPETFIEGFHCNHIHGVYGDFVEELRTFCAIRGIEFDFLQ